MSANRNKSSIAVNHKIADLFNDYTDKIGMEIGLCLGDAIMDYVGIVLLTHSKDPDESLKKIYLDFERQASIAIEKINALRKDFLKIRSEDNVLLDRKAPSNNNEVYRFVIISMESHRFAHRMVDTFPYYYYDSRKTAIKDIADRSMLLKIVQNDDLCDNETYRAWRLTRSIEREKLAQTDWDHVIDRVSVRIKNIVGEI